MRARSIAALLLLAFAAGIGLGYVLFAPKPAANASARTMNLNIVDGGVYRVRSAVDGDTIILENGLHIRYNGVNTPESGRWVRDASPISKEATLRNNALVEGKRVRLKLPPDAIDRYGRIVANVFALPDEEGKPEIEVREVLIKEGLGKAMGLGVAPEEYKKLKSWQDEAKANELGIWGVKIAPKPEEPKPFCASSNSKTYHSATCSIAHRISPANLHEYATAEEAEAVGLKPCAQCLGRSRARK